VYSWIWRHLPLGLAGKLASTALLLAATVGLLWYVVFPALDEHLPSSSGGHVTEQQEQPGPTPTR
jgi:hypothetical protein